MAKIKSALELALERTEGIKSDKEGVKQSQTQKRGKHLAGQYLSGEVSLEETQKTFKECSEEEIPSLSEGFKKILITNIKLPQSETETGTIDAIDAVLDLVFTLHREASQMIGQIKEFYGQYLQNKEQMIMQLKQQYIPQHQQKMARMQEQLGTPVDLDMEQDPEFIKLLQDNLNQLDAHFQEALEQAKAELSRMK